MTPALPTKSYLVAVVVALALLSIGVTDLPQGDAAFDLPDVDTWLLTAAAAAAASLFTFTPDLRIWTGVRTIAAPAVARSRGLRRSRRATRTHNSRSRRSRARHTSPDRPLRRRAVGSLAFVADSG